MSTSAYGVATTGWPATAERSLDSHAAAGALAACVVAGVQVALAPV